MNILLIPKYFLLYTFKVKKIRLKIDLILYLSIYNVSFKLDYVLFNLDVIYLLIDFNEAQNKHRLKFCLLMNVFLIVNLLGYLQKKNLLFY